jgi:hypothetical protein
LKNETEAAGTIGTLDPGDANMVKKKSAKKVFVSYAWESPEHQERVKQFTNQLRHDGLDATMDLFDPNPPEGLPQWMVNHIRRADFVLMVITETYRKRFEGDEEPGKGKGVKWEGGIVTRAIYDSEFMNRKFLPVVFGRKQADHMPRHSGREYLLRRDGPRQAGSLGAAHDRPTGPRPRTSWQSSPPSAEERVTAWSKED